MVHIDLIDRHVYEILRVLEYVSIFSRFDPGQKKIDIWYIVMRPRQFLSSDKVAIHYRHWLHALLLVHVCYNRPILSNYAYYAYV